MKNFIFVQCADNSPVDIHIQSMLTNLVSLSAVIKAINKPPDKFLLSASQLQNIQSMKLSEIGNLSGLLNLKVGVKAMIASNINIDEILVSKK